jgi:hypothetical protein
MSIPTRCGMLSENLHSMPKFPQGVRAAQAVNPPVAAIITILVAGTPLCLLPGVFLSHDVAPKVVITLCGAAILLLLLRQWASGIRRLWDTNPGRWFLLLAAAQCVSIVISTAASTRPGLSLAGTIWRRFGAVEQIAVLVIALAAAAISANDRRWLTSLFRGIAICGAAASLYGICQYFGFDPFLDPKLYTVEYLGGIVRPPSTMGHAIYFAAWLVPVAIVSAASAFCEMRSAWKALHASAAALAVVAIFLSGTRGALIALVAALFLVIRLGGASVSALRPVTGIVLVLAAITLSPAESSPLRLFHSRCVNDLIDLARTEHVCTPAL